MSLILAIAAAAPFADLDAIDRDVRGFTGAEIGAPGGPIQPVDRRLRLAACRSPLQLDWNGQRHDAVVVRCGDAGSWRLFVPVNAGRAGAGGPASLAVSRGDAVAVAVTGDGFTVSRPGEALESGAVGEWVRVRPVSEKSAGEEPLRAQVVRPGLVALPLP